MPKTPKLDYIFHPRSVAVVGVSNDLGSSGAIFMGPLLDLGFKGKVYPVHPKHSEAMGLKCYPSIKDIPGPVDYVIVCIPAKYTPQLIQDCAEKGVKVCTFFTAGFSETGSEEEKALENEIVEIARKAGIRLIGPNCMGIYCPSTGIHLCSGLPSESGRLGMLCQSGGNAIYSSRIAPMRGAFLSKVVSYGNACDINESDMLEYFAEDSETDVIAAYIEGAKDGQRFQNALKFASQAKPTIILKGGQTETGAATVASHTGALAGSTSVWETSIKQAGAIQVHDLDELIDTALPFLYMKPPKGRRVGIIGLGGGISVRAADSCESAGLSVPRLSKDIKEELTTLTPTAGYIYTNPVDTQALFVGVDAFKKTVHCLDEWDGIDMLILHYAYDILGTSSAMLTIAGFTTMTINAMAEAASVCKKPVAIVLHYATLPESYQAYCKDQRTFWEAGVPAFPSVERAAKAINAFIDYHERKSSRS